MARAPLTTRKPRRAKGSDDVIALKRRVVQLARLDLDVLELDTGPVLVRGRRVRDARLLVDRLHRHHTLDQRTLARGVELAAPPLPVDASTLAAFQRDVRALADPRLLALAAENRRAFARYGELDAEWLAAKQRRLSELHAAIQRSAIQNAASAWRDAVAALVRIVRGDDEADAVRRGFDDPRIDAEKLALLALAFRLGSARVPSLHDVDVKAALELSRIDLTVAQACRLSKLATKNKRRLAKLVADGLPLKCIDEAEQAELLDKVVDLYEVRAARAYITWSVRLAKHYQALGIGFSLPTELFASLPANADLAVLTHCLLEQKPRPDADPVASLDATLGLFRRLPTRARDILGRLERSPSGLGRRRDPEFATWLADDALLDRAVHIAEIAGERAISRAARADFEAVGKRVAERTHLENLRLRNERQERRLATLARTRPTTTARTKRRLRARIERLLPRAYQRELDATFGEILRQGWSLEIGSLTPAWRDAVRFWLVADDNRELLDKLLRETAKRPGTSVKDAFPQNAAWLARARTKLDVDAWLAPRRASFAVGDVRYTIQFEEDPLEVLRMGIPFGTCLALTGGGNAASTVTNAIDVNKRVVYVRNEANAVVARKLVAISRTHHIVGYRLYSSLGGVRDDAIRAAMTRFCQTLADDVGAPLATSGTPEVLTGGFWYDDGEVPFDPDEAVVADYCDALGLGPPKRPHPLLDYEALGWRAARAGDALLATRVLGQLDDSTPSARAIGEAAMRSAGLRTAIGIASDSYVAGQALLRRLATDEAGLLHALDVANRLPRWQIDHCFAAILQRFPPSPKVAVALVDLALRSIKKHARAVRTGAEHLVLDLLPRYFDDVILALDLLDAFEPVALRIHATCTECRPCVVRGRAHAAWALEQAYARRPDHDAIVAALRSRRRTELARAAALRVAANHLLPNGTSALERVPKALLDTADGVAALARQAGVLVMAPRTEGEDAKSLPPRVVVDRWLDGDRHAIVRDYAKRSDNWSPCLRAVEREATARSVSIAGFFEAVVVALASSDQPEQVLAVDGLDHAEAALAIVVAEAPVPAVAKVFLALEDALSVAIFRRALERQAQPRIAAIQAEIQRTHDPHNHRRQTFYEWLAGIGGIRAA